MYSSEDEIETVLCSSSGNEDTLLDVPFVSEEVDSVLKKLKLSKAAGHDGIQAEHLNMEDWCSKPGLYMSTMQMYTQLTQDQNHNNSI